MASPSSTFSPAAGSPWEDSAERFRQATVQVAGSDGGSRDDDGSNGGPPGGAVIGSAEDAEPSTAAAEAWALLKKSEATSGCVPGTSRVAADGGVG